MARLLPAVLAGGAVLGVLLLPTPSPERLAAYGAHELLGEPVGPAPAGGEADPRPTLGALVLEGPAAERADGRIVLALAHVRVRSAAADAAPNESLDLRRSLLRGLRTAAGEQGLELDVRGETKAAAGGADFLLTVHPARLDLAYGLDGRDDLALSVERDWHRPTNRSLIPPLVAVALAVALRRPLLALFAGVVSGVFLLQRGEASGALGALGATLPATWGYLWAEVWNEERAMIAGFVALMLAMVGVMTRCGGIRGLMDAVSRLARDARRTQIATYLMGLAVFFDDYANTILVGSTMRPLADRFRVSREKLAFLVDSTAAPVAGISIFSTWIAFEVSTYSAQLPAAGLAPSDGYAVFLRTIPYSFYCVFMLVFVGAITVTGRDFGPMLRAERRARATGQVLRPGATPMVSAEATEMEAAEGVAPRAWRAVLPLATFLLGTILLILGNGGAFSLPAVELLSIPGLTAVLSDGSGSEPLFFGTLAGLVVASLAFLSARLPATDLVASAWTTLRAMNIAFAILYLAWMIGAVCADLGTAPYLTGIVSDAIDPLLLPSLLFVLAGLVALSTGSSWSTMSILLPLVAGLAYNLGLDAGLGPDPAASGQHLMVMSIGAVLSGAIFGDHCSPISDTTVMSSIASACDHIDHVRTQLPYALSGMALAILFGYLPCAYLGLSPWIACGGGAVLLVLLVRLVGRPAEAAPTTEPG